MDPTQLVEPGNRTPARGRLRILQTFVNTTDRIVGHDELLSPGGQWAFYDSSRNRSGAWCTMSVCGTRAKSRAYRRRRKDG